MDILKGFGSEGSVVSVLLSAFLIWHLYIKPKLMKNPGKDRRKPGNPNDKPGNATECKEHAKALSRLETQFGNFKDWLKRVEDNNREDHQKIYDKIEKIRNNRR